MNDCKHTLAPPCICLLVPRWLPVTVRATCFLVCRHQDREKTSPSLKGYKYFAVRSPEERHSLLAFDQSGSTSQGKREVGIE